jgi:hypothetical protein
MAGELNVFRTATALVTTTPTTIYTAPPDYTGIILMAQIANITSSPATVTVVHESATGSVLTELVKDFAIPGNDAASATTGKLILEEGQKLKLSASANNTFKVVLSILESANA